MCILLQCQLAWLFKCDEHDLGWVRFLCASPIDTRLCQAWIWLSGTFMDSHPYDYYISFTHFVVHILSTCLLRLLAYRHSTIHLTQALRSANLCSSLLLSNQRQSIEITMSAQFFLWKNWGWIPLLVHGYRPTWFLLLIFWKWLARALSNPPTPTSWPVRPFDQSIFPTHSIWKTC